MYSATNASTACCAETTVTTFEDRAKLLLQLADANRELSSNLDHDQAQTLSSTHAASHPSDSAPPDSPPLKDTPAMKNTLATVAALTAVMALNACSTTPETPAPAGSTAPSQSSAAPSEAPSSTPSAATETSGQGTAVTITVGDQTFNATINDSRVSRDFLATLPTTTLTWERNAGIEYITELDVPLTETGPF